MTITQGFTLGNVQVLHKTTRSASTKEEKAPKNPYDLYVSIRNKPGTGIVDGVDTGKKAVVVRNFSFQKPFIKANQLDNTFKSDAVNGTIIDEKFDETFALSFILNDGIPYFVKVREDFPEVFAFFPSEDPSKKAKSPKATLTAVAEHMAANGLLENKEGEQKYFNLVPMKNADGSIFSTDQYLCVYGFEAVDIDAPATETTAATPAPVAEPAPATEDEDEVILEDAPEESEEEDEDDLVIE